MILKSDGEYVSTHVEFACSTFKQALGLMFRKNIPEGYALVFVMKKSRKVSLHMLFVNFAIGVIFLDEDKKIVKISQLRPWAGLCSSGTKVKYIIETSREIPEKADLHVGDMLSFKSEC
ncbi:DUF192 domain-containing protein [Methanolobus halotolerans]|uniref:DUF192 domain-containing protein n=1 Tax=Methanolobus halotolerans TaxID=2052935 RepID=A0A4E0PXV0_9EURY|nr:DUF192 domain-containing protein [Methanolobus halotolerans]TGC11038.1 hypothetical protein CUN85_02490 [Methanolobus halotolerans]